MAAAIPHYFLYGESTRDVDQRFLHVESIDERSRMHEWAIQPHVHRELNHLLLVMDGNGEYDVEDSTVKIIAPALICVPAQCVHGFRFAPNINGLIVTSSSALLRRIAQAHPELGSLLHQSSMLALSHEQSQILWDKCQALRIEFNGNLPARRAAAESHLLSILVDAIRIQLEREVPIAIPRDADTDLVTRFRALIEEQFRSRMGAAEYAAKLCVSHERLRIACTRMTGSSPLTLLNGRRLLEAKRNLLYTNMNIAVLARACGFDDPAYFSRFFARSTGQSPRAYRLSHEVKSTMGLRPDMSSDGIDT